MKIAIVSDIHANSEALLSVLEDIDENDITEIISLGDNIGYGAEPEIVIDILKERNIKSVFGNHEYVILRPDRLKWMNTSARSAINITRQLLGQTSLEYIKGLKPNICDHEAWFVHGFPPDSAFRYFFEADESDIRDAFVRIKTNICFVGHTHDLGLMEVFDDSMSFRPIIENQKIIFKPGRKYMINAGSVGQPRDSDNRAKYIVWDLNENSLEPRFVEYDFRKAAQKILKAGLPSVYADRLY